MPILAVPSDTSFCIDARDAWILDQDSGGVLHALQKILQAEAARTGWQILAPQPR